MKVAILVAGVSNYFPLFFEKPKCLYHVKGEIRLQSVIEDAKKYVDEKDIIVVAGYRYKYIKRFLKKYPDITLKINHKYRESAIFSFRKAIENESDDFVFMFGDERISRKNVGRICASPKKMAILFHDTYYYYSLGIFKLRKDTINVINDDKYLSMESIKEIYCFANKKDKYDGTFNINSGVCIGYTIIDFIRRIGKINEIENPLKSYHGDDIDFFYIDLDSEYEPDLDYFSDTDEYKNSVVWRMYSDYISDTIKKIIIFLKKIAKRILKDSLGT